jgi:hypothetical protein
MRLAAIYIKEHFLFKEPQTINLGGKYFYTITPREGTENEYDISRKENPNFIENFWGENIALVSAIVGENGAGKTSLLHDIFKNSKKENIIYIIEYDIATIFNHRINEPFNYWKKINFNNFNKSIINLANESGLVYNVDKTMEFNEKLNFKIYDLLDFEKKTDSKTVTKYLQFEKIFKFIIYNKEIVDEINDIYEININFFKEVCFKPNPFLYEDIFIEKEIGFYINQKKEFISRENFINLLESKKHKAFLVDIVEKYPYFNIANDFKLKIKVLFLSKVYATKYLMLSKDIDKEKYIDWIYKTKIIVKIDDNNFFIKTVKEILLFEIKNSDKKLINETIQYIEKFFKKIFMSLSIEVNKQNEKELFDVYNSYIGINHYFNRIKAQYNVEFIHEEIILFEPTHPVSQGEYFLIQLFSNLNDIKTEEFKFLMLDEADLGFHPYWKKKFVNLIVNILPKILTNSNKNPLQIFFTTHDPLTLSDIPNSNVVYLKKDGDKTIVLSEDEKPKKSFGANITDLLADSFFIGDGLIGDFAKGKIEETIEWLNKILDVKKEIRKLELDNIYKNSLEIDKLNNDIILIKKDELDIENKIEYKKHFKTINLIDEDFFKIKLLEMYNEAFPEEHDKEKEIKQVRQRAIELGIIKE